MTTKNTKNSDSEYDSESETYQYENFEDFMYNIKKLEKGTSYDSDYELDSNYYWVEKEVGVVINAQYGGFQLSKSIKKMLIEKGVPIKKEDIDSSYKSMYYIRDNEIFVDFIKKNYVDDLEVRYVPIKMHREKYWYIKEYDGLEDVVLDHKNYEKNKKSNEKIKELIDKQNELINNLTNIIFNDNIDSNKKIENLKMVFPINDEITIEKILDNFKYIPGSELYKSAEDSFNNKKM